MNKRYKSKYRGTFIFMGIIWILIAILRVIFYKNPIDLVLVFGALIVGVMCILRVFKTSIEITEKSIVIENFFIYKRKIDLIDVLDVNVEKRFLLNSVKVETDRKTFYIYDYYNISLNDIYEVINLSTCKE